MNLVLTIRTDKPEAEIGLYQNGAQLTYKKWQAHRELAETILLATRELLDSTGKKWQEISGIIYFEGPGSFTGLRIGAAVANALVNANSISVSSENGADWIEKGLAAIKTESSQLALPVYGADVRTTKPKK